MRITRRIVALQICGASLPTLSRGRVGVFRAIAGIMKCEEGCYAA